MSCPICQSSTRVINSRVANLGHVTKRRRNCIDCGKRFTTYERLELAGFEVQKRDGSKEPYYRNKLELGIRKAFKKRPITEKQFHDLVYRVENDIFNLEGKIIPSGYIGRAVLSYLKAVDKVAYLRFASVYRNFRSPRAFEKEIKKLENLKR